MSGTSGGGRPASPLTVAAPATKALAGMATADFQHASGPAVTAMLGPENLVTEAHRQDRGSMAAEGASRALGTGGRGRCCGSCLLPRARMTTHWRSAYVGDG